ncbi:MAG: hypothetical protein QXH07_05820 [Thermoplasmata archaeon]
MARNNVGLSKNTDTGFMPQPFPFAIGDMLLAVIILLVSAIGLVLAIILAQAFAGITIIPQFATVFGFVNSALAIFADGVVVVYIAINLMSIIAAYFVKTHPIFAIASILVLAIMMILVNVASNVFSAFISNQNFVAIGNNDIPAVMFIFQILPIAVFIFSLIQMFAQFGKPQVRL